MRPDLRFTSSSSQCVFSHDVLQGYGDHRIRRVEIANGATTTLAGSGTFGFLNGDGANAQFNSPYGVAIDPSGTFALVGVRPPLYHPHHAIPLTARSPRTRRRGRTGFHCATRPWVYSSSSANCPNDALQDRNNHRVRRVEIATGATTTLAGSGSKGFLDGAGGSARFNRPWGIAIDPSGTFALVAVRRPPPYPRIPPSRRRHTRLAHTA